MKAMFFWSFGRSPRTRAIVEPSASVLLWTPLERTLMCLAKNLKMRKARELKVLSCRFRPNKCRMESARHPKMPPLQRSTRIRGLKIVVGFANWSHQPANSFRRILEYREFSTSRFCNLRRPEWGSDSTCLHSRFDKSRAMRELGRLLRKAISANTF